MNTNEIIKGIVTCELKQLMLSDLRYSMRTSEEELDRAMQVPKEEADLENIEELNIKIEIITELSKHICKF